MRQSKTYKPWTVKEHDLLRGLVTQGLARKEIAERLGRTVVGVKNKIKKLKIATAFRAKYGKTAAAVRRLWRRGQSDEVLAEAVGVSRSRVTAVRKQLGLPRGVSPAEAASIASTWRHFYAGHKVIGMPAGDESGKPVGYKTKRTR